MAWYERAKELDTVAEGRELDADSSCTTGFDNDGSSGFDIFENGVELAIRAAKEGLKIWLVYKGDDAGVAYFFLANTEDEVRQRLETFGKTEENGDSDEG